LPLASVVLGMNRLSAAGSTVIATDNISAHSMHDARATFCNSVALVEGRYRASRVRVVRSDFSATPNPLAAHKVNDLLSPFSNIRAIPSKLCLWSSLAIIEGYRP
jgi:hypothetical protein